MTIPIYFLIFTHMKDGNFSRNLGTAGPGVAHIGLSQAVFLARGMVGFLARGMVLLSFLFLGDSRIALPWATGFGVELC